MEEVRTLATQFKNLIQEVKTQVDGLVKSKTEKEPQPLIAHKAQLLIKTFSAVQSVSLKIIRISTEYHVKYHDLLEDDDEDSEESAACRNAEQIMLKLMTLKEFTYSELEGFQRYCAKKLTDDKPKVDMEDVVYKLSNLLKHLFN